MEINLLSMVSDYGGLIVGVAFLVAAVAVLPGRIKWYVLTAGLAVLGYEAYMRTINRKLLTEADAERVRLRGELAKLDGRRSELETSVKELNGKLAELNERHAALNREREALAQSGGELLQRKQQLDSEAAKIAAESRQLLQSSSDGEALLARLLDAQRAVGQLDLVTR